MKRYETLFARLTSSEEGAFVPFAVLGDPDAGRSLEILLTLADAGADALELGIPFSDPLADGPVIQRAALRAREAGATQDSSFDILRAFRELRPDVPVGLLVYANLVEARGKTIFCGQAARAGVDSILVADVPTLEAGPYADCIRSHGMEPVLVATPHCREADLQTVARLAGGYTYGVTRAGVTGEGEPDAGGAARLVRRLRRTGAPPCLLGFGISRPEHVQAALEAGAAGAISGSAVVDRIGRLAEDPPALRAELELFVGRMKAATRRGRSGEHG